MNSKGSTRLRIAQVAPLWTSVPPRTYGGSELIIHLLTEELVRRGHEVTLYATGDSRSSANLRSILPHGVIDRMQEGSAHEYEHYANAAMARVLRDSDQFDVIHCHLGGCRMPLGIASRVPMLHTLHIAPSPDDLWVLENIPGIVVAAISEYQASEIPQAHRNNVHVIHHGIDFDSYEFGDGAGGYLAFLARMSPQKSPLDAIRIAQKAGVPLVLAGQPQNASEQVYFDREIQPHVDGEMVKYIGPVDQAQKNRLLKSAAALLFPIQGSEGFGLAMIEAMACGTPVIAWDRASVPEIIDTGVTGFHGNSVGQLAAAVPAAMKLDRGRIREHALSRFRHRRMTDEYIRLYESICNGGVR